MEALRSQNLFGKEGTKVKQLEQDFAELFKVEYAQASTSGTAAIHTAVGVVNPPPTRETKHDILHSFPQDSLEYFRIIQVGRIVSFGVFAVVECFRCFPRFVEYFRLFSIVFEYIRRFIFKD